MRVRRTDKREIGWKVRKKMEGKQVEKRLNRSVGREVYRNAGRKKRTKGEG